MLYELIKNNRELLLSRSADLSAQGSGHNNLQTDALGHISFFLDQLTGALIVEHGTTYGFAKSFSKETSAAPAVQLSNTAYEHGKEIRDSNLTIGTLVRNYGSVCQAITGYAIEVNVPIDVAEFKTLNWCLDEAIAQAVIAFTVPAPPAVIRIEAAQIEHDERLDDMAKMTNHIAFISNSLAAMRTGQVGLSGATGALLDSSLKAMQDLVERIVDQKI